MTHICISKPTIIGSDNGLSPDRRQAIIRTNAGLLFIGPLGTNFSWILIAILTFSFKKMLLKISSVKRRPFCPGLNVIRQEALAALFQINIDAALLQIMSWHRSRTKPLSETMLHIFFQLDYWRQILVKLEWWYNNVQQMKWIWEWRLQNRGHLSQSQWVKSFPMGWGEIPPLGYKQFLRLCMVSSTEYHERREMLFGKIATCNSITL